MLQPFRVLIVEDEALLAMELESILEDNGHTVVGWATDAAEAKAMIDETDSDIAFVDLNLSDGETGVSVAEYIRDHRASTVVFLTANPGLLPENFVGACGVIAKPYTMNGLATALRYIQEGVRRPPPSTVRPSGFTLSPEYASRWP